MPVMTVTTLAADWLYAYTDDAIHADPRLLNKIPTEGFRAYGDRTDDTILAEDTRALNAQG
jgi:hypothetical protein